MAAAVAEQRKANRNRNVEPKRNGKPPKPLCCPDTDTLWFPDGISQALEYLIRRGQRDANSRAIYHAIATGGEAFGHFWDYASLEARLRYQLG